MYEKKSVLKPVVTAFLLCAAIVGGGVVGLGYIDGELELYQDARASAEAFFGSYEATPFVNSAATGAARSRHEDEGADYAANARADALYSFTAPEGFTFYSYSQAWDRGMLRSLYDELKRNVHGDEINKLYEIVVFPGDNENSGTPATYSPIITTVGVAFDFPAFPDMPIASVPVYTGRIHLYGGDTRTTIESVAGSLSHEYGHHYTFYYMFDSQSRIDGTLDLTEYGRLREATRHGLIPTVEMGEEYELLRHKYVVEVAAEDYVTLMGSPTTRQVARYYDMRQLTEDAELPESRQSERNAFPQENMSIPLAIDMPGLARYFYSFIGEAPPEPVQEKQEITISFNRGSVSYNLETGMRTYSYFELSWNMPYNGAIYTLACFDPEDYTGFGVPIKTVDLDNDAESYNSGVASAIVGEYATLHGNTVRSANDGLAEGIKMFYVVAQLPDGTYYLSDLLEVNFG